MKIAQYRVDWLDRLRSEIIELDKIIVDSILNQNYSNQRKIMTFQSTIPYHMNPNDPNAQAIEDAIYELAQAENGDTLIEARTKFRNLARPILKREWDKAKAEIRRAGADQARRMTPQGYSG